MIFKIPKTVALEGLRGRSEYEWVDGVYMGTIEVVRIREVHATDDGGPKFVLRPNEKTAEVASIQIGNIVPVDYGLPDPGNRKFFDGPIVLSVDGLSAFGELPEDCNGRLRYTQYHLGNLAHALDLTQDLGDAIAPLDIFESLFRETTNEGGTDYGLAGAKVMFRIESSTFTRKDGSEGRRADIKQFMKAI